MKTILSVLLLMSVGLAQAADAPLQIASGKVTSSTERWADRCTDFTTNGAAFKSPRVFLQWLDVVTDPAIWLEYGNRALDPHYYVRTMSSMIDPGMPKNWLEWSNPEIPENWARAASEPDFYSGLGAIVFDPNRYMRWAMLPVDERSWRLAGKAANPETWLKWMTAPVDAKSGALYAKALDMENASKWLQAWGDPANYAFLKPIPSKTGY